MTGGAATARAVSKDASQVAKLKALVQKIRFCMMTTVDEAGALHSRPMSFVEWSEDGALLFFTNALSSPMRHQRMVDLNFCEPHQNVYVSVMGQATVLPDRKLMHRLFAPIMRNWFPGGPADPRLRLISMLPITAECWDGLSGFSSLLSLASGGQKLSGQEYFEL